MASIAASALSIGKVGALRKEKGQVVREVPMAVITVCQLRSLWGGGPSNPYVDSAIEEAQRAGVIIYSIYTPGVGHYGHTFWRMNWGQNYLSQISDETGGARSVPKCRMRSW